MIPKIIHYVWLGGNPHSRLMEKCIKSWKKHCPDYEIKEWNEHNFDINSVQYVSEACKAKKWAFASDYIRLWGLCNYGGIYMDTDVEVLKSLDKFLNCKAFSGFERLDSIPTGIMGSEKDNEMFKYFLKYYDGKSFFKNNGELDLTTNVATITNLCLEKGLILNNQYQNIDGFELYSNEYFCPKDSITKKLNVTNNTYTIHHFDGSWISKRNKFKRKIINLLGPKVSSLIVRTKKILR